MDLCQELANSNLQWTMPSENRLRWRFRTLRSRRSWKFQVDLQGSEISLGRRNKIQDPSANGFLGQPVNPKSPGNFQSWTNCNKSTDQTIGLMTAPDLWRSLEYSPVDHPNASLRLVLPRVVLRDPLAHSTNSWPEPASE